jgi:hypothetical protein
MFRAGGHEISVHEHLQEIMTSLSHRPAASSEHRLCQQRTQPPEAPEPQSETQKKLDELKALIDQHEGMKGDIPIGTYFHCTGTAAENLARQSVEAKHSPLLRAFRGAELTSEESAGRRTIHVKHEGRLLGTIETGSSDTALWKGDLIRILQINGRGLLVDHLRQQEYEHAMALESAEFSGRYLSRLETYATQPQSQQRSLLKELSKTLGLPEITVVASSQTDDRNEVSTTQLLVMDRRKPGQPLAFLEVGRRYTAGPEAHIRRVRAMNERPRWEDIPMTSVIAFIRERTGLNTPLRSPCVEIETKGDTTTLHLLDAPARTPDKYATIASVTISRKTGMILRAS